METKELTPEQKVLLEKYPALLEVFSNPKLSAHDRKLAALPYLRQMDKERAELNTELKMADEILAAHKLYLEWEARPLKLEKNDNSRLHQLIRSLKRMKRFKAAGEKLEMKGADVDTFPWKEVVPFVVQHDWAAAFQSATDYAEGGYRMPYERCAFEFRISGRSITAIGVQDQDELIPRYTFYTDIGGWWMCHEEDTAGVYKFAESQVKAICVSLDAQVSTSSVVRVSEKVNRRRETEGKVPFFSYRVINLAHRHRVANSSTGGSGITTKKRLHFRRGHWRHFAEFKTWVRWTLVGNPELGFIDKEYRL